MITILVWRISMLTFANEHETQGLAKADGITIHSAGICS